MKISDVKAFVGETLQVGWWLYFQPSRLQQHLHAQMLELSPNDDPITLSDVPMRFWRHPAMQRYVGQIALLCALTALPSIALVLMAEKPPALMTVLITYAVLVICGIGIAFWRESLAMTTVATLLLLIAWSTDPSVWLTTLLSEEVLIDLWREGLMGIGIGLPIGIVVGRGGGGIMRWRKWQSPVVVLPIVYLAGGVATITAVVVTTVVVVVVATAVAAVVAAVVTAVVTAVELGEVVVVAIGVAVGVAVGVATIVAIVVAFGVTGAMMFVVGFGVIVGVVVTVTDAVAGEVARAVVTPIATLVILAIVVLPALAPWQIALTSWLMGVGLGSRAWSRLQSVISSTGLLAFIGLVFLDEPTKMFLYWLTPAMLGFLRFPLPFIYVLAFGLHHQLQRFFAPVQAQRLTFTLWRWDELIPFPLPTLDQRLVQATHHNRTEGLRLIEEVSGTWRQRVMAQRALLQISTNELAQCHNEAALSNIDLVWLPAILPRSVRDTLWHFRVISGMMRDKITLTDDEAQLRQLTHTKDKIDDLIHGLSFVPRRERAAFLPVAQQWRTIIANATVRLPNPYIAGDPVRSTGSGLFVGRSDIVRQLQAQLANRSQRPTLVLFGQRRMGKSSLLYQLPHLFDENTIAIRIDCQAGEMQDGNTAFLYNLARIIYIQSAQTRQLKFSPIPTLSSMSFTAFSVWLEAVEAQLGERILLLSFDEFEKIGEAVVAGHLDKRIFDFLRNLIQHHPKINIMLAGSHRPAEIGRPWSDYLISAVTIPISYLQPDDVRHLVSQPIKGFPPIYTPEAVEHIIALTRCQPMLVQLLCQQIVLHLNEQSQHRADVAVVEAVIPSALNAGASLYFTYLSEYDAQGVGQALLRELASYGAGAIVPEAKLVNGDADRLTALERLLARDIVERMDGGIRFEIELVRRWWAQPP